MLETALVQRRVLVMRRVGDLGRNQFVDLAVL